MLLLLTNTLTAVSPGRAAFGLMVRSAQKRRVTSPWCGKRGQGRHHDCCHCPGKDPHLCGLLPADGGKSGRWRQESSRQSKTLRITRRLSGSREGDSQDPEKKEVGWKDWTDGVTPDAPAMLTFLKPVARVANPSQNGEAGGGAGESGGEAAREEEGKEALSLGSLSRKVAGMEEKMDAILRILSAEDRSAAASQ